jgi:hypothetical protein
LAKVEGADLSGYAGLVDALQVVTFYNGVLIEVFDHELN